MFNTYIYQVFVIVCTYTAFEYAAYITCVEMKFIFQCGERYVVAVIAVDILDLVRIKKYASGMLEKSDVTRSTWLSEESDGSAEMVSLSKFLMGVTESYGE